MHIYNILFYFILLFPITSSTIKLNFEEDNISNCYGVVEANLDEKTKNYDIYAPPFNKWGVSSIVYSTLGENSGCKISIVKNDTNGNIRIQVRYNTDKQTLDWKEYLPGTWINAQTVHVRITSTSTGGNVILQVKGN